MLKLLRQTIFHHLAMIKVGEVCARPRINGFTRFNKNTRIGVNANFNGMVVYGSGSLTIGDNFHSGKGCKIITQSHNHDGNAVPYDSTYKIFDIRIENNVWLGMNVTLIGNIKIGEGAIIQVGSVVVSDIPPYSIAGGHPAKVFAKRNVEKYQKLVAEKKFH